MRSSRDTSTAGAAACLAAIDRTHPAGIEREIIVLDPVVAGAVSGEAQPVSDRSVQRHFQRVLGMRPDDTRLPDALSLAPHLGLTLHWKHADLGDVHPNTACIEVSARGNRMSVLASSTGGGVLPRNWIGTERIARTFAERIASIPGVRRTRGVSTGQRSREINVSRGNLIRTLDESLRHVRQPERRLADVIRPLAREFVPFTQAPSGRMAEKS